MSVLPSNAKKRRASGHNLVELAMLAVLFAVFAVFGLDVGFMLMGSQMNDAACRDAARAAAQGNDYTTAMRLARAALAAHRPDGYFVTQPQLETSDFQYEDFSGSPPADTSPYVTVTTSTNVRIPAPVFFMGASFGQGGTMAFRKTYTFPIVKTTLYL